MNQSAVSVDVVTLRFDGELRFAATPRVAEPFIGEFALPGVLLGEGERLRHAAERAVATKLHIPDVVATGQLAVFDEPHRDPRGPTLSVAMWAVVDRDGVAIEWRALDDVGTLAFDHARIVKDAREIMGASLWRDLYFTRAVTGCRFSATAAATITASLTGPPDRGNLNRTLKSIDGLERSDDRVQARGTGRPAAVWKWI